MPHILHRLLIAASKEKIYQAITKQEDLAAWWTPDTIAIPEKGSIARFNFGAHYCKEMHITGLQTAQRVQWLCITGAEEWINTSISFELSPVNQDTLLSLHPELAGQAAQQNAAVMTLLQFRHRNWQAETPMFAECNYTWGRFLWSLKLYCETGKGLPWPGQHTIHNKG